MKFGWYRLTSGLLTITGSGWMRPLPRSRLMRPTFVTFAIEGHCDLNADPIRCVADRVS